MYFAKEVFNLNSRISILEILVTWARRILIFFWGAIGTVVKDLIRGSLALRKIDSFHLGMPNPMLLLKTVTVDLDVRGAC